ncbi:hypothetical protein Tco_0290175 [Tanacetum coccineum]
MHLKRQIEELLKIGKLSHVIKELMKNNRKDPPRTNKKGETSNKDKALAILMVQPCQRVARQRITQSFSPDPEISFLPLEEEEGAEGPMSIEAKIGGHFIHRMHVDGGVQWRNHMAVGANITAGEYWRRGTFNLGLDELYDRVGIITLKSSKIIPIECAAVSGPEGQPSAINQTIEERTKVAINPKYPEQTIMIGSTLTEEGQNKLSEVNEARAVWRKSHRFTVINGVLYKKSFLEPWLRCVGPLQENYVLREIYEGSCVVHAGTRSVVAKALRT